MIDTKHLRQRILDLAVRGKLVSQDPNDEPASVLLERVRVEKQRMVAEGKLKRRDVAKDSIIYVGEDSCHYEKVGDAEPACVDPELPSSSGTVMGTTLPGVYPPVRKVVFGPNLSL